MPYPTSSPKSKSRCAAPIARLIACLTLAATAVAAYPPAVSKITAKEIQSLVAKNKGKVVLLNFWATWCSPCAHEFPALVKLYDAYKAKGLEVIAVSMNDFSEMQEVANFVRQQKPTFPLYIAGTVEEVFYQTIDKRWSSGLPLTMIYDKTGRLRFFHEGERTYAQFEQDIQSLIQ
ncbi:MAG: TlpA family protein disulfide reductase [Nitrospira sp.]|nr:TlpA family protein disulfide reductase [Nitrospira sp.]